MRARKPPDKYMKNDMIRMMNRKATMLVPESLFPVSDISFSKTHLNESLVAPVTWFPPAEEKPPTADISSSFFFLFSFLSSPPSHLRTPSHLATQEQPISPLQPPESSPLPQIFCWKLKTPTLPVLLITCSYHLFHVSAWNSTYYMDHFLQDTSIQWFGRRPDSWCLHILLLCALRNGNFAGFPGHPPRPAPIGTGIRIWQSGMGRVQDFFKNPNRVRGGVGCSYNLPRPAPSRIWNYYFTPMYKY